MPKTDLEALEKLWQAATPGEWRIKETSHGGMLLVQGRGVMPELYQLWLVGVFMFLIACAATTITIAALADIRPWLAIISFALAVLSMYGCLVVLHGGNG